MSNFFNMCKYDVWKHEFALAAMSSTGGRTAALPQLLTVCRSLNAAFTDSLSMVHSLKADVKTIIRLQSYHIFIVEFIFLLSGGHQQTNTQGWIHYCPESGGISVSEGQEVTRQTALHHGLISSHLISSCLIPYYRRERKKPLLHIQARLKFGAAHMDKPNAFWRNVL